MSWLRLGAVRSRLFGGPGHLLPADGGSPRELLLSIGPRSGQQLRIDGSSPEELDVLEEVVVDRIYPLDRITVPPRMILDCGANIGCFASLCRVAFPNAEMICWEPNTENFNRLRSQPLLRSDQVTLFCQAISDRDGIATLQGTGAGCTVHHSDSPAGEQTTTISLQRWLAENGQWPLLIKMDIEGHESQVLSSLRGCWQAPCTLLLETHAMDGEPDSVIDGLVESGFQVEPLRTHRVPNDPRVFREYFAVLEKANPSQGP